MDMNEHDRIVKQWKWKKNGEKAYKFLRNVKRGKYWLDPDPIVAKLRHQVFDMIDCTQCANCCKVPPCLRLQRVVY